MNALIKKLSLAVSLLLVVSPAATAVEDGSIASGSAYVVPVVVSVPVPEIVPVPTFVPTAGVEPVVPMY